jgi:hypothetical protein
VIQQLRMRPVALVKPDIEGFVVVPRLSAVGCGGRQCGVLDINHDDILVVEMRGRRLARIPAIRPDSSDKTTR